MLSLHRKSDTPFANIQSWLESLATSFPPAELEVIRRACELSEPLYQGKFSLIGAPQLSHAVGTAAILVGMHMDHEMVAAAILHAIPEYLEGWQTRLEKDFGTNVKVLVEGLSRMEKLGIPHSRSVISVA